MTQPSAHPQDSSGQERAKHRAGGADQRDAATTAIADLVAEPRPERGAHQDGGDDPGGKELPLHGHILASPAAASHLGLPTLAS